MTLQNRRRILSLARYLDRCALRLRAYVRANTPKRPRKSNVVKMKGVA